jgi:general secretion pathway protein G
MNTRTHAHNAGFTLVEILIVVVILGILSAIVIPQFTSASESAKASAMTTQLQTIRSQLELYRVQHNGYPDLNATDGWKRLTQKTTAAGNLTAGEGESLDYGPYLQKAPVNPFASSSTIGSATVDGTTGEITSSGAAAGVGWVYDQDSGAIKASVDLTVARNASLLGDNDTNSADIETYTTTTSSD